MSEEHTPVERALLEEIQVEGNRLDRLENELEEKKEQVAQQRKRCENSQKALRAYRGEPLTAPTKPPPKPKAGVWKPSEEVVQNVAVAACDAFGNNGDSPFFLSQLNAASPHADATTKNGLDVLRERGMVRRSGVAPHPDQKGNPERDVYALDGELLERYQQERERPEDLEDGERPSSLSNGAKSPEGSTT